MTVTHVSGDAYTIETRGGLQVRVDQPTDAGGADTGPTPTELFVAALAGCVAFYAGRYLRRHGLDPKGLRVDASFTMATDSPARVASVRLRLTPPDDLSAQQQAAFLAVASHCTVHNTLQRPPAVDIALA
jgi:uncharacterized OsmC-like protein